MIPAHVETLIHADDMDSKTIDETGTSLDPSPEEASKYKVSVLQHHEILLSTPGQYSLGE